VRRATKKNFFGLILLWRLSVDVGEGVESWALIVFIAV
jgi:hypothetical protein